VLSRKRDVLTAHQTQQVQERSASKLHNYFNFPGVSRAKILVNKNSEKVKQRFFGSATNKEPHVRRKSLLKFHEEFTSLFRLSPLSTKFGTTTRKSFFHYSRRFLKVRRVEISHSGIIDYNRFRYK